MGKNIILMKDLVALLERSGCYKVKTYIQSGNAVFQTGKMAASEVSEKIRSAIKKSHGFIPHLLILTLDELDRAIASNPYPGAESQPKTLHLFFLASAPRQPDLKTLENLKSGGERFTLKGKVFYLHAPDGIGKSRLAASVEKSLGVAGTARNWRSVCRIKDIARQSG